MTTEAFQVAWKCRRCWFDPWAGKVPWSRKWQPTPLLLPGKFCGQRSLAGYSSWGCKESDTTERLSTYGLYMDFISFTYTPFSSLRFYYVQICVATTTVRCNTAHPKGLLRSPIIDTDTSLTSPLPSPWQPLVCFPPLQVCHFQNAR